MQKKELNFYKRENQLGSSDTKSDDVVFDFISKNKCENIIWYNAIAPLQTLDDIKGFTMSLRETNIDSQFATKEYLQAIFKNKPLNFSENKKFPKLKI